MSKQEQFNKLTILLLSHKYRYYIQNLPTISDYDYDMLELNWMKLGRDLGIDMDSYPFWVDFDFNHPLADKAIERVLC
jgi:hypothetical protein